MPDLPSGRPAPDSLIVRQPRRDRAPDVNPEALTQRVAAAACGALAAASVRDIGRTRYGSAVVATVGGKRVRLGAPALNMSFAGALDRDYGTKLAQLREYWQVMMGKMTSA